MRYIADLHIHSKYSRACSRDLILENIGTWCDRKGIDIVGTGDFTHPAWFKEIGDQLITDEPGLFRLKNEAARARFMLTTEISCIYKQGGQTRRLHICLIVPDLATIEKINTEFDRRGFNRRSDGRPIIGCSAKNLAALVLEANPQSLVFPAHAWTPWFSVFGSKSGFNSLEECFEELTPNIYAIETGLSSDPAMNWRWSALDNITLLSNSDCHSPANLGREANIFDLNDNEFNYTGIYEAIKNKDRKKIISTIEFFPEEGKYHFDGHADCQFVASPAESEKLKNICPRCGKKLILGVCHRVNDLADRESDVATKHIPYQNIIPLAEIIAATLGVNKNSKKVINEYRRLTDQYSEFKILLDLSATELQQAANSSIAESILKMRRGEVVIAPGYDGIFGTIKIKNATDKKHQEKLI